MRASSQRMTASVPAGTTAPVAMRRADPAASGDARGDPACASPMTVHGPSPATAQPSIAELSKVGRSQRATQFVASTLPEALGIGSISEARMPVSRAAASRASCQLDSGSLFILG